MMMNMWLVVLVMYLFGNVIFVSKYKHLMIVLLSLEFIILGMYMYMLMFLMMLNYNIYMLVVFLVFSVCEGALGLSILVSMIRTHGNDYFQSYNLI